MLRFITGDLLDTSCDIIGHGVNCRGKMASGVARQIRNKFPVAYDDYIHKHYFYGWNLGDVQLVYTGLEQPRFIANMATQCNYGYDDQQYASYNAINNCLDNLLRFADREKYSIAIPWLGCGLGGCTKENVFDVINQLSLKYYDVNLEVYSLSSEGVKK